MCGRPTARIAEEHDESLADRYRRGGHSDCTASDHRRWHPGKWLASVWIWTPAAEVALGRLRKRLEDILAIDYFGAPGRAELESLFLAAEEKLRPPRAADPKAVPDVPSLKSVRGRTWVTRKGIHVDRICSAWLIRRFIDPGAKLKYVLDCLVRHPADEARFAQLRLAAIRRDQWAIHSETGSDVDSIGYSATLGHLYVPGGGSADLSILSVASDGKLTLLGKVATASDAHTAAFDPATNSVFVATPGHGAVLVIRDPFPPSQK